MSQPVPHLLVQVSYESAPHPSLDHGQGDDAGSIYVYEIECLSSYVTRYKRKLIEDATGDFLDQEGIDQLLESEQRNNWQKIRRANRLFDFKHIDNAAVVAAIDKLGASIPANRKSVPLEDDELKGVLDEHYEYRDFPSELYLLRSGRLYRKSDIAARKKRAKKSPTTIMPSHLKALLCTLNFHIEIEAKSRVIAINPCSHGDTFYDRINSFGHLSKLIPWKTVMGIYRSNKDARYTYRHLKEQIPPNIMKQIGAIWSNTERRNQFISNHQESKKK